MSDVPLRLVSYEHHVRRRQVILRYAPEGEGADSRLAQYLQIQDVAVPAAVPVPPVRPPIGPSDSDLASLSPEQREGQLLAHDRAIAAYQEARAEYRRVQSARERALAEQLYTAWLQDPRPDHVKAEDFWRRSVAIGSP